MMPLETTRDIGPPDTTRDIGPPNMEDKAASTNLFCELICNKLLQKKREKAREHFALALAHTAG